MGRVERIEQYLDFMVHILRADGVVEAVEKQQFLTMMVEGLQLRPEVVERYRTQLEAPKWDTPSDAQLAALGEGLDPGSLSHMVKDGYSMAWADGSIDPTELELIQRFLVAVGIPESRLPDIDKWARVSLEVARKGQILFRPVQGVKG